MIVVWGQLIAHGGVIKTVIWDEGTGGNGHNYMLWLPIGNETSLSWTDARSLAESSTLGGSQGNLVSVNSAAEDLFLRDAFSSFLVDNGVLGQMAPSDSTYAWIGLSAPTVNAAFEWTTGEPLAYTNWAPLEPNGFGTGLWQHTHYWTRDFGSGATWSWNNEQNAGFEVVASRNRYGFIAEFSSVPEPTTFMCFFGLILWTGCHMRCRPIQANLQMST